MTENIEGVTMRAIGLALDAAALRQQAAAANIANVNTPGYDPVAVTFEAQLEEARLALQARGVLDGGALEGVAPALHRVPTDELGLPAKVMLDVEVAGMAQNAAHYQALLKLVSKHHAILSAAVSDGKR